MPRFTVLDTEDFLAWLGHKLPLRFNVLTIQAIRNQLATNFCAIVMSDEPKSDPYADSVIVVEDRKIRDFFAFVSTYVADYAPFTAFFRVMTTSQLDLLFEADAEHDDGVASVTEKLVGTAIVEAVLYIQNSGSSESGRMITLAAASATYSAAALQGLGHGPYADLKAVGLGWQSLRSSLGNERLPISTEDLADFWQTIQSAVHDRPSPKKSETEQRIIKALKTVIAIGRINDTVLDDLLSLVPELRGSLSRFRGTRESRAKAVQEALGALGSSKDREGQLRECVAGCLLSTLGDGSFRFFPAALAIGSGLPMAPLWFAVWSGLQDSSDIMTEFNCMGRRMVRDMRARAGLFHPPTDDISLFELVEIGTELDRLPRGQNNSVSVEIYPGVSSRQGISRGAAVATFTRAEYERDIKELRSLITKSSELLTRMDRASDPEATLEPDPSSSRNRRYRSKTLKG